VVAATGATVTVVVVVAAVAEAAADAGVARAAADAGRVGPDHLADKVPAVARGAVAVQAVVVVDAVQVVQAPGVDVVVRGQADPAEGLADAPKRVKHRKQHRGRRRGMSRGQVKVQFGEYGLKSLEQGWLTNRQIEAARIAMTRKIKRGGKVWINVFPDKPVTKKPAETRMGSGKGNPEGWVAVVKPGRVMFELAGVPEPLARDAIRLAAHKLPVKSKFVMRED